MKIEELLSHVEKLPPAPSVLPKLLKLLGDVNSDPGEVVALIRIDPALTAQVLRLSNSVYYGASRASYDLEEAIGRIGFREAYKLVAMVCGQNVFNRAINALFLEKGELWEYSLSTGYVMEQMAAEVGGDPVTAYTIGLLHAIGKIVITSNASLNYDDVFALVERDGISLTEAERQLWGFTQCEVGAALLRKWNFKEDIIGPIEFQDRPAHAGAHRRTASMLHLSIFTVASLGLNCGKHAWAMKADAFALHHVNLPEDRMQVFMVAAYERLSEVKTLLAHAGSVH